ncbi:MAG: hypothetical protein ACOVP4_04045 [Bacteriovoracaceae bacterium]
MKVLLIACLSLLSLSAMATSFNCGEEKWVTNPGVSNGVFTGKLAADCTITTSSTGSIQQLKNYYEDEALRGAYIVHSGPVADSSLGGAGLKYDLTVKSAEGLMRSIVRMTSDEKTKFYYVAESKEIKFSGMSEYLQKLDIEIKVQKLSETSFKLTLINLTKVRKPALAPAGIFDSIAQKNSKKEFRKNLLILAKDISSNL